VTETPASIRKEIKTFLGLTIVISAVAYVPLVASYRVGGTFALGAMMALVWAPGIAALATRYHYHEEIYGMGWGWGENRFQAIAFLLPLAYGIVAYGGIWLTGYATLEGSLFGAIFSLDYLHFLFVFMLSRVFLAAGEEIGWRGFLVPQLAKLTDFTRTSLISGAVWTLWHYPFVIFAEGRFIGVPLLSLEAAYSLCCFTIVGMSAAFTMNWLRLRSGSLWTSVLFRAGHALFLLGLLQPMTRFTANVWYLIGEYGGVLAVANLIIAFFFWRLRDRLPDTRIES
jgi:membrane protease YdiL (CAAX protease family)